MSELEEVALAADEGLLEEMRARLRATRWPEQRFGGWDLGVDLAYARELCAYWAGQYDWRATEARLNAHTNLRWEGLHCLRVGEGQGLPVVLLHGWPSGPLEYLAAAELLAEAGHPAIVPSLPGYAWSEDPGEALNATAVAARIRALVEDGLAIERYAVAGGDWGGLIAARIAYDSPGGVAALYVSTPATLPAPGDLSDPPPAQVEQEFAEAAMQWRRRYGHHMVIQSTAPDAVSAGLNDSPAGLAAYLLEKYRRWSDSHGEIESRFSKDELCDFLTMFWANGTIAASMRLYWAERRDRWRLAPGEAIATPAAVSVWAAEMVSPPREWTARVLLDLRRWTKMENGGHFAAFEEPEAYVADLGEFLSEIR